MKLTENTIREYVSTRHIEVMKAFDHENKLYYNICI